MPNERIIEVAAPSNADESKASLMEYLKHYTELQLRKVVAVVLVGYIHSKLRDDPMEVVAAVEATAVQLGVIVSVVEEGELN